MENNPQSNMNNENGMGGSEGGTSVLRRVVAVIIIVILLVLGAVVLPMFLASRQADMNNKANAEASAAAEKAEKTAVFAAFDEEKIYYMPSGDAKPTAAVVSFRV